MVCGVGLVWGLGIWYSPVSPDARQAQVPDNPKVQEAIHRIQPREMTQQAIDWMRELGYGWDEVHDEAEILEHAISDRLLDRIDAKLGHPVRDPHGDPIPAADGRVPAPPARRLSECGDGETVTVARISDDDPEMLRYFDSVGITLDSHLRVVARRDFAGMISVEVAGATVDTSTVVPGAKGRSQV